MEHLDDSSSDSGSDSELNQRNSAPPPGAARGEAPPPLARASSPQAVPTVPSSGGAQKDGSPTDSASSSPILGPQAPPRAPETYARGSRGLGKQLAGREYLSFGPGSRIFHPDEEAMEAAKGKKKARANQFFSRDFSADQDMEEANGAVGSSSGMVNRRKSPDPRRLRYRSRPSRLLGDGEDKGRTERNNNGSFGQAVMVEDEDDEVFVPAPGKRKASSMEEDLEEEDGKFRIFTFACDSMIPIGNFREVGVNHFGVNRVTFDGEVNKGKGALIRFFYMVTVDTPVTIEVFKNCLEQWISTQRVWKYFLVPGTHVKVCGWKSEQLEVVPTIPNEFLRRLLIDRDAVNQRPTGAMIKDPSNPGRCVMDVMGASSLRYQSRLAKLINDLMACFRAKRRVNLQPAEVPEIGEFYAYKHPQVLSHVMLTEWSASYDGDLASDMKEFWPTAVLELVAAVPCANRGKRGNLNAMFSLKMEGCDNWVWGTREDVIHKLGGFHELECSDLRLQPRNFFAFTLGRDVPNIGPILADMAEDLVQVVDVSKGCDTRGLAYVFFSTQRAVTANAMTNQLKRYLALNKDLVIPFHNVLGMNQEGDLDVTVGSWDTVYELQANFGWKFVQVGDRRYHWHNHNAPGARLLPTTNLVLPNDANNKDVIIKRYKENFEVFVARNSQLMEEKDRVTHENARLRAEILGLKSRMVGGVVRMVPGEERDMYEHMQNVMRRLYDGVETIMHHLDMVSTSKLEGTGLGAPNLLRSPDGNVVDLAEAMAGDAVGGGAGGAQGAGVIPPSYGPWVSPDTIQSRLATFDRTLNSFLALQTEKYNESRTQIKALEEELDRQKGAASEREKTRKRDIDHAMLGEQAAELKAECSERELTRALRREEDLKLRLDDLEDRHRKLRRKIYDLVGVSQEEGNESILMDLRSAVYTLETISGAMDSSTSEIFNETLTFMQRMVRRLEEMRLSGFGAGGGGGGGASGGAAAGGRAAGGGGAAGGRAAGGRVAGGGGAAGGRAAGGRVAGGGGAAGGRASGGAARDSDVEEDA